MSKPVQTPNDELFNGISKLLYGKPIDAVAPVLVVAVARVLMLDGEGDPQKTAMLIAKFMDRLTNVIHDMMTGDPEGTIH